jgi:hypothetical protein
MGAGGGDEVAVMVPRMRKVWVGRARTPGRSTTGGSGLEVSQSSGMQRYGGGEGDAGE